MEQKKPQSSTIDEQQRRILINNFFKISHVELPSLKKGRIIWVYVGFGLGFILMFYLKNAVPTIIICTACFVFAFWHFYVFIKPYFQQRRIFAQRASQEEMCSWLVKDLKETVKPVAIKNIGLNMSDTRPENIIIIPVPIYWNASGINASDVLRNPLNDGTYIYSMWRVQILVLAKYCISLFKCNYCWITNTISGISTNEFYFQDITSVRNDIEEIEFGFVDNAEQKVGPCKVFRVTNNSGEYLTVVNDIPTLQVPKNVSVNLEYMVSLLRMVVRNRRFGINHEEVSKEEQQVETNPEAERDKTIEKINSIHEVFDHDRDGQFDNVKQSQFDDEMSSSFDDNSAGD